MYTNKIGFLIPFTLLITLKALFSFGQADQVTSDSLEYHAKISTVVGSAGFAPFWLVSNKNGVYAFDRNDLWLNAGGTYWKKVKKWSFEAGFDGYLDVDISKSFINNAFVNVKFGKFKLMGGWQEFTAGQYSKQLSTGSFALSNNARNIPRIGIGFYDYVTIPFTDGWLQIKGAMNHGWLEDDRFEHSKFSKSLLHEKFLYIRTRKIPINPYVGLIHVAMYGGEDIEGNKVGTDFWAVFFGQGSDASGILGEATNAIGEHMGILDLGATVDFKIGELTFYYQKPIDDGGGFVDRFKYNDDMNFGFLLETKRKSKVSAALYEYVRTDQQLGYGIPDPVVEGKLRLPFIKEDREWLANHYKQVYPNSLDFDSYNEQDWYNFLETETNFSQRFGGRADYYNSGLYRHVYKGRTMGSALFITKPILAVWDPNQNGVGSFVISNRVEAHHFGIEGWLVDNLHYRVKYTYSINKGAWQQYEGRYSWRGIAIDPDFEWYWKGDRNQSYSVLELSYALKSIPALNFDLGLGYDFGDIYHNFGANIGVKYQINRSLK